MGGDRVGEVTKVGTPVRSVPVEGGEGTEHSLGHVRTQREGGAAGQEVRPPQVAALPAPWPWTASLRGAVRNQCLFQAAPHGIPSAQPWQTKDNDPQGTGGTQAALTGWPRTQGGDEELAKKEQASGPKAGGHRWKSRNPTRRGSGEGGVSAGSGTRHRKWPQTVAPDKMHFCGWPGNVGAEEAALL